MIPGLVISSGMGGEKSYQNRDDIEISGAATDTRWEQQLAEYDLLIAPNGTENVDLFRKREQFFRGKLLPLRSSTFPWKNP